MINQRQIIWQVPGKNWSVEDFFPEWIHLKREQNHCRYRKYQNH